jgi:hypothetical protein
MVSPGVSRSRSAGHGSPLRLGKARKGSGGRQRNAAAPRGTSGHGMAGVTRSVSEEPRCGSDGRYGNASCGDAEQGAACRAVPYPNRPEPAAPRWSDARRGAADRGA